MNGGTAHASGWSVHPIWRGWQWSAYGPLGSEYGVARTREEAEQRAQRAHARVRRRPGVEPFADMRRIPR